MGRTPAATVGQRRVARPSTIIPKPNAGRIDPPQSRSRTIVRPCRRTAALRSTPSLATFTPPGKRARTGARLQPWAVSARATGERTWRGSAGGLVSGASSRPRA